MDHIVIIGNGFDLAHGLETKYGDFISWYLKDIIIKCSKARQYSDNLVSLKTDRRIDIRPEEITLENGLDLTFDSYGIKIIKYNSEELFSIIKDSVNANWVDIEFAFYKKLQLLVKTQSSRNRILNFNNGFFYLKSKLINYLSNINYSQVKIKDSIREQLYSIFRTYGIELTRPYTVLNERVLVINFNYTSLIKKYIDTFQFGSSIDIINIHGSLDEGNIIFGYGDLLDKDFHLLEDANNPDLLKHIKQYYYLQDDKYARLEKFIYVDGFDFKLRKYDIHIMGHSCGISDRVLLNKLFDPETCNSIKIYYHKIDEHNDDFFEKTQNIIRNFKSEYKHKFGMINNKRVSYPLGYN